MGKIIRNGVSYSGSTEDAVNVKYDNSSSGVTATNVQGAIDEVKETIDDKQTQIDTLNSNLTNTTATANSAYTSLDYKQDIIITSFSGDLNDHKNLKFGYTSSDLLNKPVTSNG